jgi:hypothetical protein
MRNFLIILPVNWLFVHAVTASAFMVTDTILYEQKVFRDDRMFEDIFRSKVGILYLTDKKLEFKCKRPGHDRFNFSIPYGEIKSIRTFYGYVIPNRIKIRTTSGESFRLATYKRRKIIRITREQMAKF